MADRGREALGAVKNALALDSEQVKKDLQTKFIQFYREGIRAERQSVVKNLREDGQDLLADFFKEAKHVEEGEAFDYVRNIEIVEEDDPEETEMGEAHVQKANDA